MPTAPSTRVAIVTGGSRGIGRSIVERLARERYSIVVNYASDEQQAQEAVRAVTEAGASAIAVQADVADEQAVARLFDLTEETFGGVDVVAHAAGLLRLAPLAELELDSLDSLHRTNIRGTFVVDQQALRRLRPGGALINFSSSVIARGLPGYAAYAASKGAVEAMTLTLANELRGRDVTVNAVAPGPTATAMFLDGKDELVLARAAAQSPLERIGTPQDSAELVAFLASPAGHWINGQVIRANGGLV
jgi:3-oxoacyl-[acyl-carrier protein] reductase